MYKIRNSSFYVSGRFIYIFIRYVYRCCQIHHYALDAPVVYHAPEGLNPVYIAMESAEYLSHHIASCPGGEQGLGGLVGSIHLRPNPANYESMGFEMSCQYTTPWYRLGPVVAKRSIRIPVPVNIHNMDLATLANVNVSKTRVCRKVLLYQCTTCSQVIGSSASCSIGCMMKSYD